MDRPTPQTLRAWEALLHAHRRLTTALDDELQTSCGLRLEDYDVLVQVARGKGEITMSTLAGSVLIGRGSLTRLVDQLLERGLVVRRRDDFDGRVIRVSLTEAGRRVFRRAARVHLSGIERLVGVPLGAAEVATLAATLTLLVDHADH